MTNDQVCSLSINSNQIPKDKLVKAQNGKLYLAIEVHKRREADQYGNTLNITLPKVKGANYINIGSGKIFNFKEANDAMFDGYLAISFCLSDFPTEKIYRSADKLYLNIEVRKRQVVDRYNNNLSVICARTKEEREAKTSVQFCGNGKTMIYQYQKANTEDLQVFNIENFIDRASQAFTGTQPNTFEPGVDDDLPF